MTQVFPDLQGVDIKLPYTTHDVRRVIKEYYLDLNLYWTVRLMECMHNYSPTTVTAILKDKVKKMPGHPGYNVVKETMRFLSTRTEHGHAYFSQQGVANLYRLTQCALVADYTVKLDILADLLNRLDIDGLNEIIDGTNRCGMNLLMIKIEEYMGDKERQHKELAYSTKYVPPKIHPPSEAGKELLRQTIADLDGISIKEKRGN